MHLKTTENCHPGHPSVTENSQTKTPWEMGVLEVWSSISEWLQIRKWVQLVCHANVKIVI
jgi:hypothetical protein